MRRKIVLLIVAILICVVSILGTFLLTIQNQVGPYQFTPFVTLNPCLWHPNPEHSAYYPNQTVKYKDGFIADLATAKDMGFQGIRLINDMYLYDDGNLGWALDKIGQFDLDCMIAFFWFDRTYQRPYPEKAWSKDGFPDNETQTDLYCEYLSNVTKIVKDKPALHSYSIIYPFNSSTEVEKSKWLSRVQTTNYKTEMQRMVDSIRNYDTAHPIYVSLGLWVADPRCMYNKAPLDLNGISGLGFHHYTTVPDVADTRQLDEFFQYFDKKGFGTKYGQKTIFVDEWGIQTNEMAEVHVMATSEKNKAKMIEDYIDYFWDKPIVWCYFGLHDYIPEKATFGLVEFDNNELKPSGKKMKELLTDG